MYALMSVCNMCVCMHAGMWDVLRSTLCINIFAMLIALYEITPMVYMTAYSLCINWYMYIQCMLM